MTVEPQSYYYPLYNRRAYYARYTCEEHCLLESLRVWASVPGTGIKQVTHLFLPSLQTKTLLGQLLDFFLDPEVCTKLQCIVIETGCLSYDHISATIDAQVLCLRESDGVMPKEQTQMFGLKTHHGDICNTSKIAVLEMRFDNHVGFDPLVDFNSNLTLCLAVYLSMVRWNHGQGHEVPFPCDDLVLYEARRSLISATSLASFEVNLALETAKTRHEDGDAFNVASKMDPCSFADLWPKICEYFELKGVPPASNGELAAGAFVFQHAHYWREAAKELGLYIGVFGEEEFQIMLQHLHKRRFTAPLINEKARKAGMGRTRPDYRAYYEAFNDMRAVKLIPSQTHQEAQDDRVGRVRWDVKTERKDSKTRLLKNSGKRLESETRKLILSDVEDRSEDYRTDEDEDEDEAEGIDMEVSSEEE